MHTRTVRRVYVWEAPVRVYHWVNALAITALVVTGYIIGRPFTLPISGEASFSYYFGWVRFIHFAAAFVFFFNSIGRLYWAFVGNQYALWDNYVPRNFRALRERVLDAINVVKVDVLEVGPTATESIGHNALAAWSYLLMFLVCVFQVVTGFGLYAPMSNAWLPRLFTWIVPLMGGDLAVRQWHHVATWFFVLFAMVHVYLALYHDYVAEHGDISSMIGGWKFVPKR
jgi:Ni/Fe-hydrogenase 1 B-type cytochrome subunit